MHSRIVSPTAICLLALALTACVAPPSKPTATTAVTPTISEEARKALIQAEADVALAREKFALWTSAESALEIAREAAKIGDSASVTRQSGLAADLANLGIAQLEYPSTERK
jgi:hypothetical protein